MNKAPRPLLIFDGECRFCSLWVARWQDLAGGAVEFRKSQDVALDHPEIPPDRLDQSVQWIGEDGVRHEGADAVLHLLASASWFWRMVLWIYRKIPGFARVAEFGYRMVARNRGFFSLLTRIFWGEDVRRPTFGLGSAWFLRALGGIYLIAFWSFGVQAEGLIGDRGILPVREFFLGVEQMLDPAERWFRLPTLLWFSPGMEMVSLLVWVGVGCSILILLGVVQPAALLTAWGCYLSLVLGGQVFYSFQWDALLLEAGFLAVFLAPWKGVPNLAVPRPHPLARFLLVWLLFRLMFAAGVVKLSSGDPVWANGTALVYHFYTQPLPNPPAWFFAQAPVEVLKFACFAALFLELVPPFLLWAPARLRHLAAGGLLVLQIAIAVTGNYGFFNLLSAALLLLLVQDSAWPSRLRTVLGDPAARPGIRWDGWILPPLAAALFLLSLVPLSNAFRIRPGFLEPLVPFYQRVAPFQSLNGYGLFARMTTTRPEILLEGSQDGREWRRYVFRYQPGPLDRPPPVVAPYMPRLDWQMWFAALGDVQASPWMAGFARRLLEASPPVLALLEEDPFAGEPPRYLRAMLDGYEFTNRAERSQTGNWWKREPLAIYFQEVESAALGR